MKRMNTFYVIVAFFILYLGIPNACAGLGRNTNDAQSIRAYADFVKGNEGQTFVIYVLNNDQGISEGVSSLEIIKQPKFGVAEVLDGLTIKYTPVPGNTGADEFWYKVCGKDGSCDEAQVIIDVIDYDFVPVANNDTVFLVPGIASEINVLDNDSNLFDLPILLNIVTDLKNGSSYLNDDGLLTCTFDGLFTGLDSLQYQITDKEGDYNQAWVFYFAEGKESDKIFIPHGISPNGDGFNDEFIIPDLQGTAMEIKIFDVLGNVVYSDSDYNNKWDGIGNVGKFAGDYCTNGTYYFLLRTTDIKKEFSGFIYIKR